MLADRRLFCTTDAAWTEFLAALTGLASHRPRLEKLRRAVHSDNRGVSGYSAPRRISDADDVTSFSSGASPAPT